jgi:hypothetical protein
MYIPAGRSIPLLEKQGEFQMETGVTTNSAYANVSTAITNDMAVSINGNLSYRNFTDYYDVFTHKNDKGPNSGFLVIMPDLRGMFSHRYGEISVGRINIVPKFPLKLEIFGGAGAGRATDDFVKRNYKTDYYSFFGQGNFGVKKRKLEGGISVRLAYSMFNYTYYKNINNEDSFFQTKFSAVGFEPMGFARVGGENLKAVFRIGFNFMLPINLNKEDSIYYRGFTDSGNLDYTAFHFSVGLSYRMGGNKKMK